MTHPATVLRALVAAAALTVPAAVAAPAGARPPARAQLTGFACHSTLDPVARRVSIVSVMRPIAGTRRLSVRFSLLQQLPGAARAHTVGPTGDLGVWLTPADATLGRNARDVWKLAKSVYDVAAPARYRFRVDFRWLGADGRVLAAATRQTRLCSERELRPDVMVKAVTVTGVPGEPQRDHYAVVVANRGRTASGRFRLSFTPAAGAAASTRTVASLQPGAQVTESFDGPVCDPAAPPTVVADPTDRVEDSNRANNSLTVACPAS